MKYKYIVWVGGIDNHYDNYQEAFSVAQDWVEKGYDDVIFETVPENMKRETDKTIKILVDGGCVTDVFNLPDGFDYIIIDSDVQEECEND